MDLDDLYRFLRAAHVQAQGVVDTLRDPLLVLDPDLTVRSANPAFYKTFLASRDATVGQHFYALGNGQWDIDELRFLLEKVIPKSTTVVDYEVNTTFPDLGSATMLVSAQRLLHPDSGRHLILLTIVDATERRKKERGQDILLGETHHRMKNLLSVTQALARQTRVDGRTAEQFREDFLSRFVALGNSFEISTRYEPAELHELAQAVLKPYFSDTAKISFADQPAIPLQSDQAMSVGMILQELATNAVKHGALSKPGGQVAIDWDTAPAKDGESLVHLHWTEIGGPETLSPGTTGFGTRLIESTAQYQLGGQVEHCYASGGLKLKLSFPVEE